MATGRERAAKLAEAARREGELSELAARLAPRPDALPTPIRNSARLTAAAIDARCDAAGIADVDRAELQRGVDDATVYAHHIENFIGEVRVPVGIAGPLRVNGLAARTDYVVPLATTEAALVASYSRGMQLVTEAGGCAAWVITSGVSRAPGFVFRTTAEAGLFVAWAVDRIAEFRAITARSTRHGALLDVRFAVEGNHVFVAFEFSTGDAAGQNMVTIATQSIAEWIVAESPVTPRRWYVEANFSGDKKASAQAYTTVRGRKVTAEAIVDGALVERRLGVTAEAMSAYWRTSAVGAAMSGTMGIQGHIANGIAALSLATGQDIACVAEAAVGITRMEATDDGALYASVTLPNLIVGTVGGGTSTPTATACLNLLGLRGDGHGDAIAELFAATALAGEISIVAAIAAGHFTRGHRKRARGAVRPADGARPADDEPGPWQDSSEQSDGTAPKRRGDDA